MEGGPKGRHTLRDMLRGCEARTRVFVCTLRSHVTGTVYISWCTPSRLCHKIVTKKMTVCKSSVHDASVKTEIILLELHDVYT